MFEQGRSLEACRTLSPLLIDEDGQYDLPTLSLLGRAIEYLKDPRRDHDPILTLETK